MSPIVASEWIQFGALGVLALVLLAAGKYFWERDQKSQNFLHDMVRNAEERHTKHMATWTEMINLTVSARQRFVASMDNHDNTMSKQHDDLLRKIAEIQNQGAGDNVS